MKPIFFLVVLSLITVSSFGQTQEEMNQEAKAFYQKTEKELNTVYQEVLKQYKSDLVFIKNLKASQKIWIQFRDAEMRMKYPGGMKTGGSARPMCWYNYITDIIEQRIGTLNVWANGTEEGDVCKGNIKVKK